MFDSGSAVGHWNLDSSGYVSGANAMHKSNETITGGMFKAQLAYDIFKKAAQEVVKVIKESVGEWNQHAFNIAQTESVLKSTGYAAGMTKDSVIDLASSMSDLTGIEDDTIQEAENLLLTFTKVGKDIFPQATETILDMSVALKQSEKATTIQVGKMLQNADAMSAAKKMGVSFTDEQIKMGKALFESGHIAEYQAMVLKELQTEFGGSAKAARDTFGGALKALGNAVGDVKEGIGMYIATAGRPFVENMIKMTKGAADFLSSKEGIKQIGQVLAPVAGIFAIAWDMGSKLFDILKKFGGNLGTDISNAFTTITGKGNESNVVFNVLGGIVKGISIGFVIMGKVLKLIIQGIADLVGAIGNSVNVLGKFGEALFDPFNPKRWKEVGVAAQTAGESFVNLGKNFATNIVDIIETSKKEFASFGEDSKKTGNELQTTYNNSANGMIAALNRIGEATSAMAPVIQENLEEPVKNAERTYKESSNFFSAAINENQRWMNNQVMNNQTVTDNTADELEKRKELYKSYADTVASYSTNLFSALGESLVKAAQGEKDAWGALADAAKDTIARIVEALGQEAIVRAALAYATLNIPQGILYTAAAAAAFTGAGVIRALGSGGEVSAGESVVVGEYGPEVWKPKTAGTIYNNQQSAAMESRGLTGGGNVDTLISNLQAVEAAKLYAFIAAAMRNKKILVPRGALVD